MLLHSAIYYPTSNDSIEQPVLDIGKFKSLQSVLRLEWNISRNNNTLNGNNVESTIAARIEQKQKDNTYYKCERNFLRIRE